MCLTDAASICAAHADSKAKLIQCTCGNADAQPPSSIVDDLMALRETGSAPQP